MLLLLYIFSNVREDAGAADDRILPHRGHGQQNQTSYLPGSVLLCVVFFEQYIH